MLVGFGFEFRIKEEIHRGPFFVVVRMYLDWLIFRVYS